MTINAKNPTEYLCEDMEHNAIWVDAANEEEAIRWFSEQFDGPLAIERHGRFWSAYDSNGELVNDFFVSETRPYQE